MNLEDGYLEVLGTRVHYLRAGTGPALVLIHGLVGSSANWSQNIAALATNATVYAIDLPNMGRSQRVSRLNATLEGTADRVAAIMDALEISDADVVGHSHGGAVALMLAARHPERVCSLVLFAPANPYSTHADSILRFYNTVVGTWSACAAPYLPTEIQNIALRRMYGDPARIPAGCLNRYIGYLRVPGTIPHVLAIVRGWFEDMKRLAALLPKVSEVPTLLIWGDCDRAVDPNSARQLQHILRRSRLVMLPGCGHVAFEEMPERSNEIMLEWLRNFARHETETETEESQTAPDPTVAA